MATIRLRHGTYTVGKRFEYFYDGLAVAEDGWLELDASNQPWIRRAWVSGYNITPEGKRLWTFDDVNEEISRQIGDSNDGTEASDDSGRQPEAANRIRKSQPARR